MLRLFVFISAKSNLVFLSAVGDGLFMVVKNCTSQLMGNGRLSSYMQRLSVSADSNKAFSPNSIMKQ